MTVMSSVEAAFCRSAPWRGFARHTVLPWALRDAEVGSNVLEIGGGSGAMAYEFLKRERHIHLTMADLDPGMVTVARRRLQPFGDRATVVQGNASSLEFPDGQFDTLCTWLMLHHTIRWPEVLAEAARVLRPGGTIVGYDLTDSGPARTVHHVDRSAHRMIRPDDLFTQLEQLDFERITVDSALVGLVMRFRAKRPS